MRPTAVEAVRVQAHDVVPDEVPGARGGRQGAAALHAHLEARGRRAVRAAPILLGSSQTLTRRFALFIG